MFRNAAGRGPSASLVRNRLASHSIPLHMQGTTLWGTLEIKVMYVVRIACWYPVSGGCLPQGVCSSNANNAKCPPLRAAMPNLNVKLQYVVPDRFELVMCVDAVCRVKLPIPPSPRGRTVIFSSALGLCPAHDLNVNPKRKYVVVSNISCQNPSPSSPTPA
jgi:hypothetical protein